jgi:hypothetical protein
MGISKGTLHLLAKDGCHGTVGWSPPI